MVRNKIIFGTLLAFLVLSSFASAITGKIGNARIIIYSDVGETVERSIRVINDNGVPVTINLTSSENLADSINILDNNFILQPGEELDARFEITANKLGTTNSQIRVDFIPEEGSVVSLNSNIIVIVNLITGVYFDDLEISKEALTFDMVFEAEQNIEDVEITMWVSGYRTETWVRRSIEFDLIEGTNYKLGDILINIPEDINLNGGLDLIIRIESNGGWQELTFRIIAPVKLTGNFSDYGLDTNGNGLYDFLTIETELEVFEAGVYNLEGELSDQFGNEIEDDVEFEGYLDKGVQKIILKFGGLEINQNRENGPYVLSKMVLIDEKGNRYEYFSDTYLTSSYEYIEFEKPGLDFGEIFDYGLDTNGNGLYDFLIIEIPIVVNKEGIYEIEAGIDALDNGGEFEANVFLNQEDNSIILVFDGANIYDSQLKGSYKLDHFRIEQKRENQSDYLIYVGDEYETAIYNFEDFEHEIPDTIAPEINIFTPKNNLTINGDYVILMLETNENAVCEFSLELVGLGYGVASAPKEMEITGENFHSQSIKNLKETHEGEEYHIQATCTDESGNSTKEEVKFDIDLSDLKKIMILENIGDYEYINADMQTNVAEERVIAEYKAQYYNNVNKYFYDVEVYELTNKNHFEELIEEIDDDLIIATINGQQVYFLDEDDGDYGIIWIHENLVIGISVDNFGEEEPSFDQLVDAYLEKYPSDLHFDITPPTIELINPEKEYMVKTSSNSKIINFEYEVNDESEISSCSLIIDGKVEANATAITKGATQTFSKRLDRDSYDWKITCVDSEGNEASSEIRDLKIKKKPSSSGSISSSSSDEISLYYERLIYEQSQTDSENALQEEQMLLEQQDYVIVLNPKITIKDEGFFESIINFFNGLFG